MLLTIVFGFLAGLVTVASPCILPILPIALSASAAQGRSRPLGVVLGLVASFSLFTLAITRLVALLGLSANTLRIVAVVVLALLGLAMIAPALQERLELLLSRLPGLAPRRQRSGFAGGLLTGAALGLVWAPCAGPILAAITTLAATQQVTPAAVAVTASYALGVGVPLLVIAYGGRSVLRRVPALSRRSGGIQRAFGVVMVITALLIAFNADAALTVWATGALPAGWNDRLQAFEDTPMVRAEIDRLLGRQAAAALAPAAPPVIPAGAGKPGGSAAAAPAANANRQPESMPDRPAVATSAATLPTPPAAATPAPTVSPLPDGGVAPELAGITHWVNSPPLTLAALRGKVVLIDFWTYSCINCLRTLPYVTSWYEKYHDQGLVVIGVHTPEFAFERETTNVEQASQRYHIAYPVAQDNDYATWNAYDNRYWPAEYFIDAQGHLRHTHFGEGNYDESEEVIQQLLAEAGAHVSQAPVGPSDAVPFSQAETPETYLGLERQSGFASPEPALSGRAQTYSVPAQVPLHGFALGGSWTLTGEYARADAAGDTLRLHFVGRDVYLVLSSDTPATVSVTLPASAGTNQSEDVDAAGRLHVGQARLYHLARLAGMRESTLDLHFDQPGVRAYAFTFGS